MNEQLKPGDTLTAETSKSRCVVEELLGGGGQGEVYRARLRGPQGELVALKWYLPHAATPQQRATIDALIAAGAPSPRFLWPQELVSAPDKTGFGYVMPLRAPRFKGIVDLMKRRIEPSFRALATAGLELSDSYLQLHARGLCYRDISFGNVFFDPDTGEALICDNDNVGVDTAEGGARPGVLGTPRFMAPEVVRGEALPSTETDLFSLAVLLFYMLHVHHPLEGKRESEIRCMDLPAMTRLYGTDPLFLFDPQDDSNRPVPGLHDNALAFWPLYPTFLRELFTRAFTVGLRDPKHGRVRESEWRAALAQLRDSIVYCQACAAECFYDAAALRATGGGPTCWACGASVHLPARIRVGRSVVMLNHDGALFPHHLDEARRYDFSRAWATVAQHPQRPELWGLQNRSDEKWVVVRAGAISEVPPGKSVALALGTRIHFGRTEGEIRV
ncbi:MAG TPA: serine/threonine protein kinase [Chloroflexota bacterium]|nr:serine/threonine protein kinase [Chloroflexota bacterium]